MSLGDDDGGGGGDDDASHARARHRVLPPDAVIAPGVRTPRRLLLIAHPWAARPLWLDAQNMLHQLTEIPSGSAKVLECTNYFDIINLFIGLYL